MLHKQDGEASDFPLVAAIPANQQCNGEVAGQENVCLVRCQNDARAGPFGGVVPVQMVAANNEQQDQGNATATNATNGNNATANTAAEARRRLALRVRAVESTLATIKRRYVAARISNIQGKRDNLAAARDAAAASSISETELAALDADEIAELLDDGEI